MASGFAGSFGACSRARIAVMMLSPIAVDSCSVMVLIAFSTVLWASVGGTRMFGLPDIDTTATLYFSGRLSTNATAACLAAASRLGWTSVASIDSEASITTTIVARSRGTSTWVLGCANAAVRVIRLNNESATATWRRHCDCLGTTTSSIEVLVKRM